jgi:hypothetical protein
MIGGEMLTAIVCCLVGAGAILGLTRVLGDTPVDTPLQRTLHLLAAGWLVMFAVWLMCLLQSAIENLP